MSNDLWIEVLLNGTKAVRSLVPAGRSVFRSVVTLDPVSARASERKELLLECRDGVYALHCFYGLKGQVVVEDERGDRLLRVDEFVGSQDAAGVTIGPVVKGKLHLDELTCLLFTIRLVEHVQDVVIADLVEGPAEPDVPR